MPYPREATRVAGAQDFIDSVPEQLTADAAGVQGVMDINIAF
jgi:hypothetical protein